MPQPKGSTGNPNGRPKGTPNKVAREIKEKITFFLEAKFEDMAAAFEELTPEEKVRYYEKLMPYAIPKNAAISFEIQDPEEVKRPSWLTTQIATLRQPDVQEAEVINISALGEKE